MTDERTISIEAVRVPPLRESMGSLTPLGESIRREGLRHPICVWKDGTLISGGRRLRSHFLLGGSAGGAKYRTIRAVFVDTLEDAAKRIQADDEDGGLDMSAVPWKPSETCRLWKLLRLLDEPAALVRADIARRRGVELRRKTFAGERQPGRSQTRVEDFVLATVAPAFGMSTTTAKRLWTIYTLSLGAPGVLPEKVRQARDALLAIDAGESSISANYAALVGGTTPPAPLSVRQYAPPTPSAQPSRQLAAWEKALPQLEGLTAGLIELGPPNPELTWDQVGPVHTRLMVVRRELEKMIKQMRESNKS